VRQALHGVVAPEVVSLAEQSQNGETSRTPTATSFRAA
jgi:hypothetical protein